MEADGKAAAAAASNPTNAAPGNFKWTEAHSKMAEQCALISLGLRIGFAAGLGIQAV